LTSSNPYDGNFYNKQITQSFNSANVVVPLLIDLFHPKSVADVGCGMGTWLKTFLQNGVKDILGFDGEYINIEKLLFPPEYFRAKDLRTVIKINKKFDLVISLEVAEHLPPESADNFIDTITELGSIVFFSAGIPFQGGTDHKNEKWQSYWAIKFKERNYQPFDIIRPLIWDNENVQTCYAQNSIVYIKKDLLASINSDLFNPHQPSKINNLSVVHPKLYEELVDPYKQTVRLQFRYFRKVLWHRLKQRFKIK
jgi:SAM-dependent methyltransferase